jgi:hypothetical protein
MSGVGSGCQQVCGGKSPVICSHALPQWTSAIFLKWIRKSWGQNLCIMTCSASSDWLDVKISFNRVCTLDSCSVQTCDSCCQEFLNLFAMTDCLFIFTLFNCVPLSIFICLKAYWFSRIVIDLFICFICINNWQKSDSSYIYIRWIFASTFCEWWNCVYCGMWFIRLVFSQHIYISLAKTIGFHYIADKVNVPVIVTWNSVAFCNRFGNDTSYSYGHVFRTTTLASKETIRWCKSTIVKQKVQRLDFNVSQFQRRVWRRRDYRGRFGRLGSGISYE